MEFPFPPFRGQVPANSIATTAARFEELFGEYRKANYPLQVALPDAACQFQVLELDKLPKNTAERMALIRLRMEKEMGGAGDMDYAYQVLGGRAGKVAVYICGVDRRWSDWLQDVLSQAGMDPAVVDAAIAFVFNRFHARLMNQGEGGALLSVQKDAWSLIVWDSNGYPQLARARWRDPVGTADDAVVIEAERLIRAYVSQAPGRAVQKLYVHGSGDDLTDTVACFDERMRAPCVSLTEMDDAIAVDGLLVPKEMPAAAVATALIRA